MRLNDPNTVVRRPPLEIPNGRTGAATALGTVGCKVWTKPNGKAEASGVVSSQEQEKRGVPRQHGKHAAWELLSPDLRCFWNQSVENLDIAQEYGRSVYVSNQI